MFWIGFLFGFLLGVWTGAAFGALVMGRLCALRRESEYDVYSHRGPDHPARAERAED